MVLIRDLNPRPHGGNVIRLELNYGRDAVDAKVFVTQGERSIGVVLYREGKPIAAGSFDGDTLRRVKTQCLRWLSRRRLTDDARITLINELGDTWDMLVAYRRDGPDISHGWLGSTASRRMPEILEDAET